jgi:hypothetical protein
MERRNYEVVRARTELDMLETNGAASATTTMLRVSRNETCSISHQHHHQQHP